MKGILGRKAGMTHIFLDDGKALPVTVIQVEPNVVLDVKTLERDGYTSIQLGYADKKEGKANKSELGVAKKANTSAKYFIKEIRGAEGYQLGDVLDASVFEQGQYVDITGVSKGKGFAGPMKRWNLSRGPMSHGSKSHRVSGSMGPITGNPIKGKKLPGRLGGDNTTMQNLLIVAVDLENNAIMVKGSIAGPNKSFVVIREALKHSSTERQDLKLVNVREESIKNELLAEAKKFGAEVNTSMSIAEMKTIIAEKSEAKAAEDKEMAILQDKAKELKITNADKFSFEELKDAVSKAEIVEARQSEDKEESKEEVKATESTDKTESTDQPKEEAAQPEATPEVKKESKEEVSKEEATPEDKTNEEEGEK